MPSNFINRIDKRFAALKKAKKKAFVAYIAAGDPNLKTTEALALRFEKAGVHILELGVPFSDPLADGVVNQLAAARALKSKTTLPNILKMVARLRKAGLETPIVFYIYYNLIHRYGLDKFVRDAKKAGVDGVLSLDLPPEEADRCVEVMEGAGIHPIYLIAPTTPLHRIRMIGSRARGFIYYVSREGVTGMRKDLVKGLGQRVQEIRRNSKAPVVIGFGISTPEHVSSAARLADGCVVGSAIVDRIGKLGNSKRTVSEVSKFVGKLSRPLQ
jgi:tryptophan synthase alpha chain